MDENDRTELTRSRFQEFFDLRYALKDEVRIVRSIVFGGVGLILTGVAMAAVNSVLKL